MQSQSSSQFDEEEFQNQQDPSDEDPYSEDEAIGDYKLGGYHPVHVGEVFINRYVVIQKLGWGHFSTVWLAKDFKYGCFVAIKIQKSASHFLQAAYEQVQILQEIFKQQGNSEWQQSLKGYYPGQTKLGREHLRTLSLLNCFIHNGPYGSHFCFVFEVFGSNLYEIMRRYKFKGIAMHLCRRLAKQILVGLDYLHRVCGIIHTDLKPDNILLCLNRDQIDKIVQSSRIIQSEPSKNNYGVQSSEGSMVGKSEYPLKTTHQLQQQSTKVNDMGILTRTQRRNRKRTLKQKLRAQDMLGRHFASEEAARPPNLDYHNQLPYRNTSNKRLRNNCQVVIADMGNACWKHHHFASVIQTRQYRSPQTLLGVSYNTNTDLWSFACMMFELATGSALFDPHRGQDYTKNQHHLALIQQKLGSFQRQFKWSGKKSKHYFQKDGMLRHFKSIPTIKISTLLTHRYKFTEQSATSFQQFLLPLLQTDPQSRASARQALSSSWLTESKIPHKMTHQQHQYYIRNHDILFAQTANQVVNGYDADKSKSVSSSTSVEGDGTRMADVRLVDRSFTDLGYIGYCDGLSLAELDQVSNWQFEAK